MEYTILSILMSRYRLSVNASINPDARIYSFGTSVELEGVCDYPEERSGESYVIDVHGYEHKEGDFEIRLSNRHVRDKDGERVYRKVRGVEVPVYDVPEGIGLLEKTSGTGKWTGYCWVSPRMISDILVMLPHIRPLYVSIHERKVGQHRWINGLSLQTSHPAFE